MNIINQSKPYASWSHRKTALALTIGAAMAAACTGGRDSSDNFNIKSSPIQLGQAETGFPAVGDVLTNNAGGGGGGGGGSGQQPDANGTCTGVLVHPSYILTAAHCVPLVSFRVGTSPADFVTYPIDSWFLHPSADMVLAHLASPILNIAPLPLNTSNAPPVGTTCTAVGFGNHNESGGSVTVDLKRSCTESIQSVNSSTIVVAIGSGIADHGDSGGPLLCGGLIAAIVRDHTDGNFPSHTHENYTPVDAPWVASRLPQAPSVVLQRASDTLLWTVGPDGSAQRIGNGLGMEPGTDVSIADLGGGGYEIAWNGGGGQLWTLGYDNIGRFTGQIMAPKASPVIAGLATGGAQIVFQNASDGLLWTLAPDGTATRIGNGLGIAPGTRLSLARLAGGGYELAWNGGGGQLWTLGPDNIGRFTGHIMAPGASPAIAGLSGGGAQIVFQNASDSLLWTIAPDGTTTRIGNGLGIAAGTRPGLTALAGGGTEIAWNGGGGQLWTLGPDNIGRFTGYLMRSDATPSITAVPAGGAEIAFATATGVLWTLTPDGAVHASQVDVQPGTDPAINPFQHDVPSPFPGVVRSIALQRAVDTLLWTVAPNGTVQRIGNGLGMEPGTDVSYASLTNGGYELAWNGGGGQLWTLGSDNIGRFTGQIMAPKASPVIAGLFTGGAQIVFQNASDGLLWTIAPNGTISRVGNGLGIAPGTRLSLAPLAGGGYELAWNGGGGQLWTLGRDNIGRFTGQIMAPGASPAVVGLIGGAAQIVFQNGSDTLLWTIAPDGTVSRVGNGLGIAAGTRPAFTLLGGGGTQIAWNGGGGQLWTLGPDNIGRFTGYVMRSDATPGITALPAGGAEIEFVAATGFLWTLTPDGAAHASQVDVQPGTDPAIKPFQ